MITSTMVGDDIARLSNHSTLRIPNSPLEDARHRLESVPGDPFLFADWERVLFLHFVIPPEAIRPYVSPFELELHNGQACMSVVAVTMRHFRSCRFDPLALPFCGLREQRFLNLRTYVRYNGEPGAFFLHGWLSRPLGLPLPSSIMGLSYTFADSTYQHVPQNGFIRGSVKTAKGEFTYRASMSEDTCRPAELGSIPEFVMERYSGFFSRKGKGYVFRAWHPVWLQQPVDAIIERDDLITSEFPEWKQAKLVGASLAPGFPNVELGKAHPLPHTDKHRALSRFFEMP
jgi:uncharacterized protein YqjF (DUF2071 family)